MKMKVHSKRSQVAVFSFRFEYTSTLITHKHESTVFDVLNTRIERESYFLFVLFSVEKVNALRM